MIVDSVHVKGFRSIYDEVLYCEQLTALVGANGAGKSSFLKGLDLFYNPSPKLDAEDFYNGDTSKEISVSVTFKNLSQEAVDLFLTYIQDGKLTVERIFSWDSGKVFTKYHGASRQNPDFKAVRDGLLIKDRGKTAKDAYELLRKKNDYAILPAWTTIGKVPGDLTKWETDNPNKCLHQRDDGQFFGFKEVAQGYLGKFTRFLFIPAVRDASADSADNKGGVLSTLMDLVVRSVIASKAELIKLKEETQQKYNEILDPEKLIELKTLSDRMSTTLKEFVPDAKIELSWLPLAELSIPLPQADVKLIEDGYSSTVSRTGHGLQRAFILTMLQHLALAQTVLSPQKDATVESISAVSLPNLVLAIEEPELYQHPNRQRHLANILLQLAAGKTPGVAEKTQIIYGTHSPLFVGIDRIDQIRLLRKVANNDGPKKTRIISTNLDKLAELVWEADNKPPTRYTRATLTPRLHTIMTPWMNEGFFADVAVLVEGEDDRAAILGCAKAKGHDLESIGISVIPCGGKQSMDRPALIFRQLGIPVYLAWDGDKGGDKPKPEDNHRLLRIVNRPLEDWPSYIDTESACFENNLDSTLCDEIGGEIYNTLLEECQGDFCIPKKKHAQKNPAVISAIIQKAQIKGKSSKSLNNIIDNILTLKKSDSQEP
jgi:putative ATP-dependent endonuclease of the OLD family